MKARDALLLILGLLGRGATAARLQKLVFLAVVEGGVAVDATFKPHHFGPWSPEVQKALRELVEEGLAEVEPIGLTEEGYTFSAYRITERGREELRSAMATLDASQLSRLKRIVAVYRCLPLALIVAYIYSRYPEYTELSITKERMEKLKKCIEFKYNTKPSRHHVAPA